MDFVEAPLWRLQDSVSRFVIPSAALRDVPAVKDQIELRRRALRDLEVIRCRLRPFMRCESKRPCRRLRRTRRNDRVWPINFGLNALFGR
jgi:hypothetical protein